MLLLLRRMQAPRNAGCFLSSAGTERGEEQKPAEEEGLEEEEEEGGGGGVSRAHPGRRWMRQRLGLSFAPRSRAWKTLPLL